MRPYDEDLHGVWWRTADVWLRFTTSSLHGDIGQTQRSEKYDVPSYIWRRDPYLCKLSNLSPFLPLPARERWAFPLRMGQSDAPQPATRVGIGTSRWLGFGVRTCVCAGWLITNGRLDPASLRLAPAQGNARTRGWLPLSAEVFIIHLLCLH